MVGLIRLSSSNWIFQDHQQCLSIITIDHVPYSEKAAIWNFMISRPQHLTIQDMLKEFLCQLQEFDSHLLDHYGQPTLDILSAAAQLQADILRDSSINPIDLSGDTTVIALALYCFLHFQIIDLIGLTCYDTITHLPEDGSSVDVLHDDDNDGPFLSAKAYKQEQTGLHIPRKDSGCHFESDLGTMLDSLAQLSFQLLNKQDAQHWPTALYVLLILSLIRACLCYCPLWMGKLYETRALLDLLIQDLARYYYVCTDGGQILTCSWNKENYGVRVGHYQVAVEHACILHHLWLDAGEFKALDR